MLSKDFRWRFGWSCGQHLTCLVLLIALIVAAAACAFASRPVVLDPCEVEVEAVQGVPAEVGPVSEICSLIFEGKFGAASALIEGKGGLSAEQSEYLSGLAAITAEYKSLNERRLSEREAAYRAELAELEKLSTGSFDSNDSNDVKDPNDPNDFPSILLVIAKAREFGEGRERETLLGDDFVKGMIAKALAKASEFESEGKWLDAYTGCYYWLVAIDPNNTEYSDRVDELLDKATIAASFQDSPCETSEERYEGVRKEIFIRSVEWLDSHYVSAIIDYAEMARKGIRRCRLLAEVVGTPSVQEMIAGKGVSGEDSGEGEPGNEGGVSGPGNSKALISIPSRGQLSAFSSALAGLADDIGQSPTGFGRASLIETFEQVLKLNKATADLRETVLISHFVEAALSALDPYTVIVWPKSVEDFEKMMTKEFTGIGVEITKQKGLLTVASLLPDTPAYKSGLDAGDVIEAVDGLETKDMPLMCAVHKITGAKGTLVTLRIRRPTEEKPRDITIVRDRIIVPTIRGWQREESGKWLYMIDEKDKIGYVRITDFAGETAGALEKALAGLEGQGMRGLILDLRFNLGGLLDSAVAVSDKFLNNDLIVRIEPRSGFGRWATYEEAHNKGTHPDYPIVILINSSSASASEIVAGALSDPKHNRAILVGERTHGKGRVQGITPYPGWRAQLKYTMAYYHLPSGQRVESQDAMKKLGRTDWGIGPDVEFKLRSDELRKMIDIQRENDVLVRNDREQKKHAIEEALEADPQLKVATLVMKSKLIEAKASVPAGVAKGRSER